MRTLILTGSPRKGGHTAQMTEYLAGRLDGEVEVISMDNRKDILPCRDCRYCFTHPECAVRDGMTEIYRKLDGADRIVFAAPVYFHNIPGSMKASLDRLQVYWSAVVRGDRREPWRLGGILLTGGAPESGRQFEGAKRTLSCMLEDLGAECAGAVTMGGTDKKGLADRPDVREALDDLAARLSGPYAPCGGEKER
ncbi:MAG: NAD(P)H-dependent oxidoreductase [Eubacteriales bacterium]|nr:NAD(P)H-dependent oxidoreductase [Eubacteriales bacterium]